MYIMLIVFAGVGTAYLASRVTHRTSFQLADLLIGVVGGLVGLSIGQYFGMAEASWSLGLPGHGPVEAEILQLARADRVGGVGRGLGSRLGKRRKRHEHQPGRKRRNAKASTRSHPLPLMCVKRVSSARHLAHGPQIAPLQAHVR